MNHTKMHQADLDSPHRELFVSSFAFVVDLLVFVEMIFLVSLLWIQSSCSTERFIPLFRVFSETIKILKTGQGGVRFVDGNNVWLHEASVTPQP